jgi:hypothetical protein
MDLKRKKKKNKSNLSTQPPRGPSLFWPKPARSASSLPPLSLSQTSGARLSGSPPTSGRPPLFFPARPRRYPRRRPASPAPRARPPPPLRLQCAAALTYHLPAPSPTRRLHRAAINGRPPECARRHRLARPFPFPLRPIKRRHHPLSTPRPSSSLLTHPRSTTGAPAGRRSAAAPISFYGASPSSSSPW